MTARLVSIGIEAFRGFRDRREIDLDADVVLIRGGNGVGKTSIVDAILWALTGTLPHLTRWRRHQNEEVVVNSYRLGDVATVELRLRMDDSDLLVRRTGTSFATNLNISRAGERYAGEDASTELARLMGARSPSRLAESLEQWGVLRQDELRGVLNAKPADLHSRLRELLGLAVIDQFEDAAQSRHKQRKDASASARARLGEQRAEAMRVDSERATLAARVKDDGALREALESARTVFRSASDLLQVNTPRDDAGLTDYRLLLTELRTAFEEARRTTAEVSEAERQLSAILEEPQALEADGKVPDESARSAALQERDQARTAMEAAQTAADRMSALAASAIPLLGPTCPVCGQSIDPAEVQATLSLHADTEAAKNLVAARERLAAAVASVRSMDEAERDQEAKRKRADAAQAQRGQIADRVSGVWSAFRSREYSTIRLLGLPESAPPSESTSAWMDALTEVGRAVRHYVVTAEESRLGGELAQLDQRLTDTRAREQVAAAEVERLAKLEADSEALARAVRQAGVVVTEEALTELNPKFADVYQRLAPHPTFTILGLEHEVYRNQGRTLPRLEDPLYEVSVNPGAICSVGQLNVVALSYFLALALLAGPRALPFVVLDDPLQSLDDENVLGFSDFCRHLQRERQLFVTTHDDRYGRLLERKLAPRTVGRSLIVCDITTWDRSGPQLTVDRRIRELPIGLVTAEAPAV